MEDERHGGIVRAAGIVAGPLSRGTLMRRSALLAAVAVALAGSVASAVPERVRPCYSGQSLYYGVEVQHPVTGEWIAICMHD